MPASKTGPTSSASEQVRFSESYRLLARGFRDFLVAPPSSVATKAAPCATHFLINFSVFAPGGAMYT